MGYELKRLWIFLNSYYDSPMTFYYATAIRSFVGNIKNKSGLTLVVDTRDQDFKDAVKLEILFGLYKYEMNFSKIIDLENFIHLLVLYSLCDESKVSELFEYSGYL